MSISVEGGKGRGKTLMVDLNLVPFIDFLSCLIAFLMISAVWTQISALETEQNVSPPDAPPVEIDPPPPPPLTVLVTAEGHYTARTVEQGFTAAPKLGEEYDYTKLKELLDADHLAFPAETLVVIKVDDGVAYEEMIKVLDMTREIGYPQTALAGGPPSAVPVPTGPPPGAIAPPPG